MNLSQKRNHIVIRLSVSDDVGYATNMLEKAEDGITVLDLFSDQFPANDDKIRWFIEEPLVSQPWRNVVSDASRQEEIIKKLKQADSVTILAGISGNKSRLRETTLTYLLESLTHPNIIGLTPEKIRIAFQRMPHDREDKPHIRPSGKPVYNFETFRLFTERMARFSSHLFTPRLHSYEAEQTLAKAFGTNDKGYTIFNIEEALAAPIALNRAEDIENGNLIILSPDGANKIKSKQGLQGIEVQIPSAISFAARIRNRLYPQKPYNLLEDINRQSTDFNRVANHKVIFNDPYFDALPKIRHGDDKVEIPTVTEEIKSKVMGRRVLLVDDTTDTASTFLTVAEKLLAAGARAVDVAVVYPNFSSYARPLSSKTLDNDQGVKIKYTNAMQRALTERNEQNQLLITDIYSLWTIRNTLKRRAAILGTNQDTSQRFQLSSIANFMIQAVLHSIDLAEKNDPRPTQDMPLYQETVEERSKGRTERTLTLKDGTTLSAGPANTIYVIEPEDEPEPTLHESEYNAPDHSI